MPETIRSRSLSSSCVLGGEGRRTGRRCSPAAPRRSGPGTAAARAHNAAEAAFIASTSPSFCRSLASTKAWTWTSSWNHSGKSGRMGRSISREVRISLMVGRPSRLMKPPGNLPAAATRSR